MNERQTGPKNPTGRKKLTIEQKLVRHGLPFALLAGLAGGVALEKADIPDRVVGAIEDVFDGVSFSDESTSYSVEGEYVPIADIVGEAYGGVNSANLQAAINDFIERNSTGVCADGACANGVVENPGTVLVAAKVDY